MQGEGVRPQAQAETIKLQARLEDLNVWKMEKVERTRKGSEIYNYWMACWRGRQDAAHAECWEDGCRGGQAEG